MCWYGKLFGFIVGVLLFWFNLLFGVVVGLLIGYVFDLDWFCLNKENLYWELGLIFEVIDVEIECVYCRFIFQYYFDKLGGVVFELQQQVEQKLWCINVVYDCIKILCKC